MDKKINEFKIELADYINRFIANRENSYITKCVISNMVLNRGHVIPIQVKLPEGMPDTLTHVGPCFYAEELLARYPGWTVAAIAELLNTEVNECYPDLLKALKDKADILERGIERYKETDVIVTALPTTQMPNVSRETSAMKDLPELGLTLTLKGRIPDPGNPGQSYFIPINTENGRPVTEDDWENARRTSLNQACIRFNILPKSEPLMGGMKDINNFYDYFYLVSPKEIWGAVTAETGADRIIIIPEGAYDVRFFIDGKAMHENLETYGACSYMIRSEYETRRGTNMPLFVVDCNTLTIRKMEEADLCE